MHLVANSNGQGGNSQHNNNSGQDVVVKSSSDVKVSAKYTINHTRKIPLYILTVDFKCDLYLYVLKFRGLRFALRRAVLLW